MKRIFLDSDIILDLLLDRDNSEDAAKIFGLLQLKEFQGFTTSVVIANIYYFLKKVYSHSHSIEILRNLRIVLNIIPIDDFIIDSAIESGFSDFEDAIQYYSALKVNAQVIITRNETDYKLSKIYVMNANKFLSFWKNN